MVVRVQDVLLLVGIMYPSLSLSLTHTYSTLHKVGYKKHAQGLLFVQALLWSQRQR